jgi:hypothetical protein
VLRMRKRDNGRGNRRADVKPITIDTVIDVVEHLGFNQRNIPPGRGTTVSINTVARMLVMSDDRGLLSLKSSPALQPART